MRRLVLAVAVTFVGLGYFLGERAIAAGKITCDNGSHICKTAIIEEHENSPGGHEGYVIYKAPAGVTFVRPGGATEVEAGGAKHWIEIRNISASEFTCEYYVSKKLGGDNGLEKGFCYIHFTGLAP